MLRAGWIRTTAASAAGTGRAPLPMLGLTATPAPPSHTMAPASLLGGLRLLGERPAATTTTMPALLRTGTAGDELPSALAAASASSSSSSSLRPRWGWRRAAAVAAVTRQQPFGTSARSSSGSSSSEGEAPAAGSGKVGTGGAAHGGQGQEAQEEDEAKVGKIRLMVRRYGPVAIVTYLSVYVTTLGLLFGAIEAGVNPFDYGVDSGNMVDKVTGMLEGYSWGEPVVDSIRKNPHVGNFALAWILTKFTEPLRAVITIGIVPRIARALGRAPPLQQRS